MYEGKEGRFCRMTVVGLPAKNVANTRPERLET
jgi:hypothetical protein